MLASAFTKTFEIPCHRATRDQLHLLDNTFQLVPPSHLRLVNRRKPEGFLMSSTAGRGATISYMGGFKSRGKLSGNAKL